MGWNLFWIGLFGAALADAVITREPFVVSWWAAALAWGWMMVVHIARALTALADRKGWR